MRSCIEAGLVGGEGFAVDASLIEADANRQRSIPGKEWKKEIDPAAVGRAVKEYLATLNDAAFWRGNRGRAEVRLALRPRRAVDRCTERPGLFRVCRQLPDRCAVRRHRGCRASRAVRQAEVGAARTMLERTEERFGLKPQRLAADSAYGSAPMLNWLVEEKRITPHIPVNDKSKREDGTFSRADFHYHQPTDTYVCPAGKTLTTSGTLVNGGITLLYRGSTRDCAPCLLRARCCPNTPTRKIPRSIYERARDVARSLAGTAAFERSRHDRKRIEMRFAHLKRILRLDRLRLRGPRGAQDEFVLAAIAQNLRRLAKLVTKPSPLPVLA